MRVLVIEDDQNLLDLLQESLESEGYIVDTATQGDKGSYIARTNEYDCIILDYILPHKNGADICKEIRQSGIKTPLIMVTVCNEVARKVSLLNSGADDYMTKPYSFEELAARIRAITRRPPSYESNTLTIDTLILDIVGHRVSRAGQGVYLTRKEFGLLEFMLRRKGMVVSRGMILEHVWSHDANPFSNTIEAHILNLRRKIDGAGHKKLIHSVPGRGYKIDEER